MPNNRTLKLTGASSAKHLYMKSLENLIRVVDKIRREAIVVLTDPVVKGKLIKEFDDAYQETDGQLMNVHAKGVFTDAEYARRAEELDKIQRTMRAAVGEKTTQ